MTKTTETARTERMTKTTRPTRPTRSTKPADNPESREYRRNILLFDIESTDLNASFGHTLCFGYRFWGDPVSSVITLADVPKPRKNEEPDAPLMRRVHDLITNQADILVSWYGKEFDRKFLNTRMLMAGLKPLPPLSAEHIDLYFIAKQNFKIHSGRLQAFSETLGCPISKTPVRADVWRQAMRYDPSAMGYIAEHCRADVDILNWAYGILRPYIRRHPPMTPFQGACRVCGETSWRSNGWRFRLGRRHRRVQCQVCGSWAYLDDSGRQVA